MSMYCAGGWGEQGTTETRGTIHNLTEEWNKLTNEDQLAYWYKNKTFLYCFPNEKEQRNFNFQEFQTKVWVQYSIEEN